MAVIVPGELSVTPTSSSGLVEATVTATVTFTPTEVADQQTYRLAVALFARPDSPTNGLVLQIPLFTFSWPLTLFLGGKKIAASQQFTTVRAGAEPFSLAVTRQVAASALDEDPGWSSHLGQQIPPELVLVPDDDEIYALVTLRGTKPAKTSISKQVPGDQVLRFWTVARS